MSSFNQGWPSWAYSNISDPFASYGQMSNYPSCLADSMELYQTHHSRLVQHQQLSRTTETKPRLSKEEVEILEAEFQKNHKPSSSTKKGLAESMRVENARINNWFQNRRAREKKEKNIRLYEAKQRLEKERVEAEGGSRYESCRQRDLVASSAPFPEPGVNHKQDAEGSQSPSEQSVLGQSNDSTEPSQSDDPELLSPFQHPSRLTELNNPGCITNVTVAEDSGSDNDMDTYNNADRMDDYFAVPVPMKTSTFDTTGHSFIKSEATQRAVDWLDHDFNAGSTSDSSTPGGSSEAKSPDAADIATRRNRRPARLSLVGGRSQSYTRASDLGQRNDACASMRRVSSATGSGRVIKSTATPRSPFFDKHSDRAISRNGSPTNMEFRGSAAPPTPNTPLALHAAVDVGFAAGFPVSAKFTPPELVLADPTLRTPPTTPGLVDGLFGLSAGYDMSMPELHAGVPMSASGTTFTNYLGQGNQCTSQPMSSLYLQMGQPFFNYVDATNEYDWSDVSPSTASTSSNPQQRYMSMSAAATFSQSDN